MTNKVKVLLYCTKGKPDLVDIRKDFKEGYSEKPFNTFDTNERGSCGYTLNGKIVAQCECEKVEPFNCCCVPYCKENNLGYELFVDNGVYKVEWKENINLRHEEKRYNKPENYKDDGVVFERKDRYIDTMLKNDDLEKAKITPQELLDYIGLGNDGYALYLSNVKVFDKPKDLNDYMKKNQSYRLHKYERLYNAPQNMMTIYDNEENEYILISIRPEWLYKIINGEKTIEVRKKILNRMKGLIAND